MRGKRTRQACPGLDPGVDIKARLTDEVKPPAAASL
jgi:hypothetical protein